MPTAAGPRAGRDAADRLLAHHGGVTGAGGYVALGDSISIDDYSGGPGRGGASLLYANRDEDFPEWQGRDLRGLHAGTTFSLLATDGATTRTLVQTQLPRFRALGPRPTLVT